MELKLVKTDGPGDGRPPKCKCGASGYVRQGNGWACINCALYYPTDFSKLQAGLVRLVKFVKDERNGPKNPKSN